MKIKGTGADVVIGKLLELDDRITAIASSGYANNPVMSQYQRFGFKGVVHKPYRIETLSAEIDRVLSLKSGSVDSF